jgi:flagellar FliL protein
MEETNMSKKVIIIIIGVAFLFMGTMGAGFFVLWTKMSAAVAQVQAGAGTEEGEENIEEDEEGEEEATIGTIYKLDTMIVNLADKGGKRYLRVTMELELSVPELIEEIEMRLPQLRDSVLMILPTKTYDEIGTTEGKISLRDGLLERLNSFLKTGQITAIYFTEFVVQ